MPNPTKVLSFKVNISRKIYFFVEDFITYTLFNRCDFQLHFKASDSFTTSVAAARITVVYEDRQPTISTEFTSVCRQSVRVLKTFSHINKRR